MNRRSFLSMMGFVAPVAIVKPKYFFAPPGGWGVDTDLETLRRELAYRMAKSIDDMVVYNPVFIKNLKAQMPFDPIWGNGIIKMGWEKL